MNLAMESVSRPQSDATRGRRLILVGPSGSGKSAIAKRIASQAGWDLYDSDARILERTRAKKIADIFDSEGEAFFRQLEIECLAEICAVSMPAIVATGGGLPAIPGVMQALNAAGVCVYLRASVETLWKRLNTDPRQLDDRPLLRSGGRERLAGLLKERETHYVEAAMTVDTDQLPVDEVCALLLDGASGIFATT